MKLKRLALTTLSIATLALSGCGGPSLVASAASTGASGVMASSSISTGTQITDQWIKSQIDAMLLKMPGHESRQTNINVIVYNRIVLLLGQVPTKQLRSRISHEISDIHGIKLIYNQLTTGHKESFYHYLNDSWITAKVKANMIGQVDPFHFKVVTEEGTVYLMGQVTKNAGDQAAEVAAHTSGVDKVVKIFNYIEVAKQTTQTTTTADKTQPATPTTKQRQTLTYGNSYNREHHFQHDYQVGSSASD